MSTQRAEKNAKRLCKKHKKQQRRIRIYVLNTGGTLGMVGKPLRPAKSAAELFEGVKLPKRTKFTFVDFPERQDSTNITHAERVIMAMMIADAYDTHDAFVVLHGTDSIAESSALFCMAFQRSLQKTIFLVGAQNAKDEVGSEVALQLGNTMRAARAFALNKRVGVYSVCMSEVWDGSRVRKQKERDLEYIDTPGRHPVAKCWPEITLLKGSRRFDAVRDVEGLKLRKHFTPRVYSTMEVRVDNNPLVLKLMVDSGEYTGVVLVCKGAGQLPDKPWRDEDGEAGLSWIDAVKYATKKGVAIGVVSPFQDGEVVFERYELGQKAKDAGAISLGTLTPDMADVKFRLGLSMYPKRKHRAKLQKFLLANIVGEQLPRRTLRAA